MKTSEREKEGKASCCSLSQPRSPSSFPERAVDQATAGMAARATDARVSLSATPGASRDEQAAEVEVSDVDRGIGSFFRHCFFDLLSCVCDRRSSQRVSVCPCVSLGTQEIRGEGRSKERERERKRTIEVLNVIEKND